MYEGMATSTLHRPLTALRAACIWLMRIIPDRGPGYSDALFTVKRYLLASLDASSGERVGAIQREAMLARG
jgi:hypothetical protein